LKVFRKAALDREEADESIDLLLQVEGSANKQAFAM
jgi:hypothetical protein